MLLFGGGGVGVILFRKEGWLGYSRVGRVSMSCLYKSRDDISA